MKRARSWRGPRRPNDQPTSPASSCRWSTTARRRRPPAVRHRCHAQARVVPGDRSYSPSWKRAAGRASSLARCSHLRGFSAGRTWPAEPRARRRSWGTARSARCPCTPRKRCIRSCRSERPCCLRGARHRSVHTPNASRACLPSARSASMSGRCPPGRRLRLRRPRRRGHPPIEERSSLALSVGSGRCLRRHDRLGGLIDEYQQVP